MISRAFQGTVHDRRHYRLQSAGVPDVEAYGCAVNWEPEILARRGPRYKAIADSLAEDIEAGLLDPGARLPTHRELAGRLGVTVGTVTRAYAEAERRGLVAGQVGRGTFVNPLRHKAPAKLISPATPRDDTPLLAKILRPAPSPPLHSTFPDLAAPDFVDLGHLRPAQGPHAEMLAATVKALGTTTNMAEFLTDAPQAGERARSAAGAKWFAKLGISVTADRVHSTASARQALHAVFAMLGAPGDIVLTDPVTYPGIQPIAKLLGLKLHCVLADDYGMLPDSLQLACWSSGARLLYLMPTLHNPTTTTMPKQRRLDLVEIARKYDVRIVEDEVCGVLAGDRIESFTALAAERSFCVTSLSMGVAPGLRTGFVTAPHASSVGLHSAIEAIGARPAPMLSAVAVRWIEDGTADWLLDWQRAELAARNDIASQILLGQRFAADAMAPHIWLELPEPWHAGDFARRLAGRKIILESSAKFVPDQASAPQAVRISLGAAPDRETLRKSLASVVLTLDEH